MKKNQTLDIIKLAKKIQTLFPKFYLSGGTAIMFKYNHRVSVDLDFFSEKSFSFNLTLKKIKETFSIQRYEAFTDNIDIFIDNIKVSFVFFPFKNILPLDDLNGIKLASDYDILLNKIYACGRRVESKDPFDVAYLIMKHKWDIDKVKQDFEKKFEGQDFRIYLGSLLSFEDYPELDEKTKNILFEFASKYL